MGYIFTGFALVCLLIIAVMVLNVFPAVPPVMHLGPGRKKFVIVEHVNIQLWHMQFPQIINTQNVQKTKQEHHRLAGISDTQEKSKSSVEHEINGQPCSLSIAIPFMVLCITASKFRSISEILEVLKWWRPRSRYCAPGHQLSDQYLKSFKCWNGDVLVRDGQTHRRSDLTAWSMTQRQYLSAPTSAECDYVSK